MSERKNPWLNKKDRAAIMRGIRLAARKRKMLLKIHGKGNCHICGKPKANKGEDICSYPHGIFPLKAIDTNHPEGFWVWGGMVT